ncbi:MAG: sulfotransferase [Alphaproteobacteria bacterium]|nr:sulfotransferase [Alphaproteobacteria bacterium]
MRVAEHTPHNVLHAAWLGRLFPRARFVHLIRDHADPDADADALYRATVVSAAREQAEAIPGRYLEVRQEDLEAAPRATMAQVLAFLGEPWDDAVLDPSTCQ